jgi:hypothetical protein
MATSGARDGNFAELIVTLRSGADGQALAREMASRGLDPLPMRVGFLVSGTVERLRRLVPSLRGDETGELPLEPWLGALVQSIRLVKPRSLTGQETTKGGAS